MKVSRRAWMAGVAGAPAATFAASAALDAAPAATFAASAALDSILIEGVRKDRFPGAVLIVGHQGRILHRKAYGFRSLVPGREAMTADTIFDAASLTKVVATVPALMKLFEAGRIRLNDRVTEYLPEFQGGASDVTLRNLMTHFSGLRPDLKNRLVSQAVTGTGEVFTDPLASPTGFPFKVALLQGSYSDPAVAVERTRICDLGYLREPYALPGDKIGYRCAAEPVANYLSKGGKIEDTVGRKCLCNALLSNIGHQQIRKDGSVEPPLVTVGDDLNTVAQFLAPGRTSYSAADVVESLLSLTESSSVSEDASEQILAIA